MTLGLFICLPFFGMLKTKVISNLTHWDLLQFKNSTTADILKSGFPRLRQNFFPDPKNIHCS